MAPSEVGLCNSELCCGREGKGETDGDSSVEDMSCGEQYEGTSDELVQCIEDL